MSDNTNSMPTLPPIVYAEASVRSVGGASLFATPQLVTSDTVANFYSESQLITSAVDRLRTEGFQVLQVNPITINIAAPPEVYERVFKTQIVAEERPVIKGLGTLTTATFLDTPNTALPGLIDTSQSPLADVLEGVALNEPVYYHAVTAPPQTLATATLPMALTASAFPPPVRYWHLSVPAGVSLGMNADRVHRTGITGRGVKVVMVDSGWYRHPFFVQRGYRSAPVVLGPAASNPDHDENGHGTGESANVFAVAPDVDFTMVKLNFVNAIGAFNAAVALRPDIISCSWGSSVRSGPLSAANMALAAAVANAVHQGIIVVFSAGNGHWGFPGQHPDVISAGGVYMHPDGSFEASNYASGFRSQVYPGRNAPDVCGLVGMRPRAQYIMLPVEPNDDLDRQLSGGAHPNGDETANDDGWAAFSGTSAAAPQLAGVCALMKEVCGRLSPATIRDILKRTARDVTTGRCNEVVPPDAPEGIGGHPAGPGPDVATGHGLADAFRATLIARLRCILRPIPVPPIPPIPPVTPVPPTSATNGDLDRELLELENMILGLDN